MKKTKWIISIAVIVVVAIAVGIVWFNNQHGQSSEEKLTKKLESIGADFYENFYYDNVSSGKSEEETKTFLERFTDIGIKINLDNLSRYNQGSKAEEIKAFVNDKTNIPCEINNTRAVIYPKDPYGKTDYEVKAELDCGFEAETPAE